MMATLRSTGRAAACLLAGYGEERDGVTEIIQARGNQKFRRSLYLFPEMTQDLSPAMGVCVQLLNNDATVRPLTLPPSM